ncbi:MAG: hypothetical protein ABIK44_04475 [candidate division WOR-3 bacterium]
MRYCVVLCLGWAMAFGFIPQSFRLQSTAGIWDDDYDLMFDPARILEIEGYRLWTNLSNYATGNDEQFGPGRSNLFLVGGSTGKDWQVAPAGIFDHYQFERPLFTGLFGPDERDSLFGRGRSSYAEWRDLDSNGTYDFKRVMITERNAWRRGSGDDCYFGVGTELGAARVGAGFIWENGKVEFTNPEFDYILHNYDSSLIAGRLTWLHDDTGKFRQFSGSDAKRLVLSGWFKLGETWELGAMLKPGFITTDDRLERTEKSRTDFNPGVGSPTDYEQSSLDEWWKSPYSGFDLPLTVQLVLRNDAYETWWSLGGFYASQRLGSDGGGRSVATYHRTLNPGYTTEWDTMIHNRAGARSGSGLNLGLVRRHHLAEKLEFGFGVNLGLGFGVDSLLDELQEWERVVYDNGDSLQNVFDYTRTTTSAETWLERTTASQAKAAVPVGLEFRPITPVALRLGALPTFLWENVTTTHQLLALAPRKSRTEYGDGSFSERVDEVERSPDSRERRTSFTQTTQLTYGAGFRPVENLQIDLMGFANLVDLTGWRLSATLRF